MTETITQYAIYDDPFDFPDHFVVREWRIAGGRGPEPAEDYWLIKTLEQARAIIPDGFCCIGRWSGGDPAIVEVWI